MALPIEILHSCLIYGVIGIFLEVLFTGIGSVLRKDLSAKSTTYLWMVPIYGVGGLSMESLHTFLNYPWWVLAPIYVATIYTVEFLSGLFLQWAIGRCPWHYGRGRWTILGLINLKYLPFWFIVALLFDRISIFLHAFVRFLNI